MQKAITISYERTLIMKNIQVAQQLFNLFRQIHIIDGGVKVFNEKLLASSLDSINLLPTILGGNLLFQHYQMLDQKKIKVNEIARENLPFKELVPIKGVVDIVVEVLPIIKETKPVNVSSLSDSVLKALDYFTPDTAHLTTFKRDLGENWRKRLAKFVEITSLNAKQYKTYRQVLDFADAIDLWHDAEQILEEKNQVKARAKLKLFEKEFPKFGNAGITLIENVKTLANQ